MRPGYDRVTSDIRRPFIPDLPVEDRTSQARREREEASDLATGAIAMVFACAMLVVVGLGFYSFGPTHSTSIEMSPGEIPRNTQ